MLNPASCLRLQSTVKVLRVSGFTETNKVKNLTSKMECPCRMTCTCTALMSQQVRVYIRAKQRQVSFLCIQNHFMKFHSRNPLQAKHIAGVGHVPKNKLHTSSMMKACTQACTTTQSTSISMFKPHCQSVVEDQDSCWG